MSRETAKCYPQRLARGVFDKYLKGNGIDIGCGDDILSGPYCKAVPYDLQNGDAQYMNGINDNEFDFVYSSHCLEHLNDINTGMQNWIRICKSGGYLYIVVPEERLYEKSTFPSVFNSQHRWTFTIGRKTSLAKNIVLFDFLNQFRSQIEIVEILLNDYGYDYSLPFPVDQTKGHACAQIEFVLRKF